jgi:Restriction endonuclease
MNLENMSDNELESSLGTNVVNERKILHVILEHIREVDARKLHLKRGFPSLKQYLIEKHNYSGSAADRRIEAAQLMKDVPAIAQKVRDGELNLSQIGEIHSAIKQKERISHTKISAEQKLELVESVTGLTTQQAQQQLSRTLDIPVRQFEKVRFPQDGSAIIEMTLSKLSIEKFNRAKELLAQKLTQQRLEINMANVIEYALIQLVESLEFVEDIQSNDSLNVVTDMNNSNLEHEAQEALTIQELASVTTKSTRRSTDAVNMRVNKTLTPKTRQFVLNRDRCCVFKDPSTGRVCGSKFALQTDHKHSRRLDGDHSVGNLQVLCARHNRYKYEQEKLMEIRFFA